MKATDYLKTGKAFSMEVFPPKTPVGHDKLFREGGVLDQLYTLNPDYMSCTYMVGGSNAEENLNIMKKMKADGKCIPISHFAGITSTKEQVIDRMNVLLDNGIDHILALRGDKPQGWTESTGGIKYATELVKIIRDEFGDKFSMAVSGNPEGHVECTSLDADIAVLKQKQDDGADYIMTQLCWDMQAFETWLNKIRAAGITLPVDVGVMPVSSVSATISMALSHNACVMDKDLCMILTKYWLNPNPYTPNDPDEAQKRADFRLAGLEYTIKQVEKYVDLGVEGIHLFAMNKFEDVEYVVNNSDILKYRVGK